MSRAASVSYIPSTKMPFLPSQTVSSSISEDEGYTFALAEVNGEIHLVQSTSNQYIPPIRRLTRVLVLSLVSSSTPPSALTLIDIKLFKHELATIFRYIQTTTMHPRDVRVIEQIGDDLVKYEEDKGTVFLAREIVGRMRRMSMVASRGRTFAEGKQNRYGGPAMISAQYACGQSNR